MRRELPLLVGLLLLCAGCGGSSGGAAPADSSPRPPSAAAPSPSAQPSPSPSASPSAPAAKPVLVLEPDGLGILMGESSIRHLPFETTTDAQVTAAVDTVLGPGEAQDMPACGQGPRRDHRTRGFDLLFDGTRFVGWLDAGAPGRSLTSADGVGVGITLAKLKQLRPKVQVTEDTLGPEFGEEPTGISGFLSGTRPTSKVTKVYAGETCFFR